MIFDITFYTYGITKNYFADSQLSQIMGIKDGTEILTNIKCTLPVKHFFCDLK